MNDIISKIKGMFDDSFIVLSILESPKNYIVSIADKNTSLDSVIDIKYAVDKKTFEMSEFSDFKNYEEYAEAYKNPLYKYDENLIKHNMFLESNTDKDELYHYGRKGMKWYQNIFTSGKERKARKRRLKNLEKARQAKTDKKSLEDEKKKAMETGSASDVLKFKGKYTPAEMQYITTRLNWERSMKDLQSKEISSGKSKADSVMEKVGKATNYANTGIKAYNTFANIYNAFNKKEVSLPKIDTDIVNGNRQLRKQEKQAAESKAKQEKADARKKAIETADYKDIYKNLGKLSIEDLKIASQRSSYESIIKNNWGKDYAKSIEKEPSSNNPVSAGKDYVLNTLGIDDKK